MMEEDGLRSAPVADYMKIRQHVVALAERSTAGSAMLPPMTELARRFGVTRMTVHKALKDLIRDQFLITRQGVGTFVNPAKQRRGRGTPKRCFGVVVGDGKHCSYDVFYWAQIAAIGQELTVRHHNVNLLNLSGSTPEELAKEVKDNWVDGLAWIGAHHHGNSALRLLHDSGFPVVSVYIPVDGVNHVGMDCGRHAYETARAFLKEGRKNIVFATLNDTHSLNVQVEGLRRAFAEAGEKFNERLVLKDFARVQEDLEEIMDFGIDVQAVQVVVSEHLPPVLAALQRHGVDLEDKCRVIAEPFFLDEAEGFQGLAREYRFAEEAKLAVDMLERMLEKQDFSVETKLLEFKTRMVTGGSGI